MLLVSHSEAFTMPIILRRTTQTPTRRRYAHRKSLWPKPKGKCEIHINTGIYSCFAWEWSGVCEVPKCQAQAHLNASYHYKYLCRPVLRLFLKRVCALFGVAKVVKIIQTHKKISIFYDHKQKPVSWIPKSGMLLFREWYTYWLIDARIYYTTFV